MKSTKPTKKATKKVPTSPANSPGSQPVKVAAAPGNGAAAVTKTAKAPAPARSASTVIEAKIDVGFGNQLFLRGQGSGLSWDRGIPLECVDSKTWRLTLPAQEKLLFKLLLNDTVWAQGEDVVVTPGQRVEITPAF
ncbi:MAG TPA: hypothetical protein VFZ59_02725 [Verrucomicrobiae bacterium]|nr:hypothetical protein [Verrucomicrobiae bacterium]